jgi:hypothetical protein
MKALTPFEEVAFRGNLTPPAPSPQERGSLMIP